MKQTIICPGCKAMVPNLHGKTFKRHIGTIEGCWQNYCAVIAREQELGVAQEFGSLTINAYAAQHPGVPLGQAIQSVNIHLIGLYCVFEKNMSPEQAVISMQKMMKNTGKFTWLTPPDLSDTIKIDALLHAHTKEEYKDRA